MRQRTTWYLQQDKLTPEQIGELAWRINKEVRDICEIVLRRSFPRMQRRTQPTEVAVVALMRMLRAWKGFNDHAHFRNAAFMYAKYVLIDMTRGLNAGGGEQFLREVSLESIPAKSQGELAGDEGTALDGLLRAEEREQMTKCLDQLAREDPEQANVLAFKLAGFSDREIGETLGESRSKVQRRVQRAVEKLVGLFPPDWVAS
jgi:RNA polymerase sigma factor (sigma-70 family)